MQIPLKMKHTKHKSRHYNNLLSLNSCSKYVNIEWQFWKKQSQNTGIDPVLETQCVTFQYIGWKRSKILWLLISAHTDFWGMSPSCGWHSCFFFARSRVPPLAHLSDMKICSVFSVPPGKFRDITSSISGYFYVFNSQLFTNSAMK